MANSFVRYTGNGSTTAYSIPFSYRSTADLTVTLAGVATTAFTLNAAGTTVTFNTAPANNVAIEIRRRTSQGTKLVDYASGSVLTESDLDTDSDQAFFMSQEAIDDAGDVIKIDATNFQWDAQNKRLTNVANPTSDQDAATKHYLENTWLSASDKTTLNNVNSNIAAINTVNSNMSAITTTNSNATNINTVATNIANVNTVAADIAKVITVANDLNETVSEIETAALDLQETTSEIDTVSNNIANVNTVGTGIANVNTVAGISANVTTVAGISSNVTSVANNETNINAVNSNSTNINTVAGAITNVNTVSGSIANVNSVATNISDVNAFGNTYKISATAPTGVPEGTLWFDTTNDIMKVYDGSAFANAGSSVNGTSQRNKFTATANQTVFSGNDDDNVTLAYDPNFLDVYLNGVRLVNGASNDYTATDGSTITLASGASAGDILNVVSFGTFQISSFSATAITSDTINNDRLPSPVLTVKGDGSSADGAIQLNCSQNSHGVKIKSPAHSAGQSYTLVLPTSVGTSGQVLATAGSSTNQLSWIDATETKPTVANVSQTIAPATATTITITGTNFVSIPQVDFVNGSTGAVTRANTVSFTSATSLSVNCTLATGNYYVRIENPDGNAGRSTNNIITSSTAPSFSTSAGSLGTFAGNFSGTLATISGSSDSAITYAETTSNLSGAGVTLNTSTGALTTTDFGGSSTTPTTYNFTIRITDAEGQTADRSFSLTSSFGATGGGQFN